MGRPRKNAHLLNNQVPGKVKVRSKTYGTHTRAPRGSIKEAKLNEVMEATRLRTLSTNRPAKLINDALKPFRKDFTGGLFFQYLQRHFGAQAKQGLKFSVKDIDTDPDLWGDDDLENDETESSYHYVDVNTNRRLTRMLNLRVESKMDLPALKMHISTSYIINPAFMKYCPYVDGIQLTFILLFPDFDDNIIEVEHAVLPVRKPKETEALSFSMDIPVTAASYMLFCKVEGCEKGELKSEVSKAMILSRADEISHSLKK